VEGRRKTGERIQMSDEDAAVSRADARTDRSPESQPSVDRH
jgi:hypothetical protein